MERHELPLAEKIALVDMDGTVADHHKALIAELYAWPSSGRIFRVQSTRDLGGLHEWLTA